MQCVCVWKTFDGLSSPGRSKNKLFLFKRKNYFHILSLLISLSGPHWVPMRSTNTYVSSVNVMKAAKCANEWPDRYIGQRRVEHKRAKRMGWARSRHRKLIVTFPFYEAITKFLNWINCIYPLWLCAIEANASLPCTFADDVPRHTARSRNGRRRSKSSQMWFALIRLAQPNRIALQTAPKYSLTGFQITLNFVRYSFSCCLLTSVSSTSFSDWIVSVACTRTHPLGCTGTGGLCYRCVSGNLTSREKQRARNALTDYARWQMHKSSQQYRPVMEIMYAIYTLVVKSNGDDEEAITGEVTNSFRGRRWQCERVQRFRIHYRQFYYAAASL